MIRPREMRGAQRMERVRNFVPPVVFGAIQRVDVAPQPNLQSLQSGTPFDYSAVLADCLSKSTLRLACEEVLQRPDVHIEVSQV